VASTTTGSVIVRARAALSLAAVLFLTGMGGAPRDPQITIEGPYANLSSLFLGAGSVFMNISNTGGRDVLLSASVDIPGAVTELHDVKNNRMFKVDKVVIPARGTVELQPRGMHIMIFNMPKTVREGSEISLKLRFERSGERHVPVRFVKYNAVQGGL
jgi:copper(I)-binding protein